MLGWGCLDTFMPRHLSWPAGSSFAFTSKHFGIIVARGGLACRPRDLELPTARQVTSATRGAPRGCPCPQRNCALGNPALFRCLLAPTAACVAQPAFVSVLRVKRGAGRKLRISPHAQNYRAF